jgi:hypothetical protein
VAAGVELELFLLAVEFVGTLCCIFSQLSVIRQPIQRITLMTLFVNPSCDSSVFLGFVESEKPLKSVL